MKKQILSLLIFGFGIGNVLSQSSLFVYKNNVLVSNRSVADIDSVIFKKPTPLQDSLYMYKNNVVVVKHAVTNIDSIIYYVKNTALTADFTVDKGIGYPDVFGGSASANRFDVAVNWKNNGITTYRNDLLLNSIVPNTTLQNYIDNVGDVQNPANWNWGPTSWTDIYHNAGLKNLAIMSYVPVWLSCNGKDMYGVPKNFAVYKDIITKIYQHVKGKVDLVEISNEPDGTSLMSLVGSSYTSRLTAYRDMYYYASQGIRSVDATIPIGGPALTSPWIGTNGIYKNSTEWPDAMLADSRIANNINFLSLHLYSSPEDQEIANWQAVAAKYGKPNMPIYVDEWNYGSGYGDFPPIRGMGSSHPWTISYMGYRLTNFLVQHAAGANLFDLTIISATDYSLGQFGALFPDYTLAPKMRTFKLLSVILGLGKGQSALKGISWTDKILLTNAACAVNAQGQKVVWLNNFTDNSGYVSLTVKGLVSNTQYTASVWEASQSNTTTTVRETIKFLGAAASAEGIKFYVPARSVIGLVIQ